MSISKKGIFSSSNSIADKDVFRHEYVNGYFTDYSTGTAGWTRTNHGDYTNYRHEDAKPTSSSWPSMKTKVYTFVPGQYYLYRCWVRCNECTGGVSLSLRGSHIANDWVTTATQVCNPSKADGQWHEYYVIVQINSTWTRSGTTYNCAPVLEFYCSDLKSGTTDTVIIDFDVKNIEVVPTQTYVSYANFLEDEGLARIYKDQVRANNFIEI